MKVEIILTYEEKERLLRSTAENSLACSVLAGAQSASHQPELVAMVCDEIEAAEILGTRAAALWQRLACNQLANEKARNALV